MRGIIEAALVAAFLVAPLAQAKNEAYYNASWCAAQDGIAEVRMADGTWADCLTDDFAVETDFSRKWAESIGQALLYAALTGKPPAVLLIVKPGDAYLVARWHNAADGLGIRLFIIEYEDTP